MIHGALEPQAPLQPRVEHGNEHERQCCRGAQYLQPFTHYYNEMASPVALGPRSGRGPPPAKPGPSGAVPAQRAASSIEALQQRTQVHDLTLKEPEKMALMERLERSLNADQPQSRVTVVHFACLEPLPAARGAPGKARARRNPAWQDVLGPAEGGGDDNRALFSHYEPTKQRRVHGAELSLMMADCEEGYQRFARHMHFLRAISVQFYVVETLVRVVQRVPNTAGHTLARWFGHGPPERQLREYALVVDWALTHEYRTRPVFRAQRELAANVLLQRASPGGPPAGPAPREGEVARQVITLPISLPAQRADASSSSDSEEEEEEDDVIISTTTPRGASTSSTRSRTYMVGGGGSASSSQRR